MEAQPNPNSLGHTVEFTGSQEVITVAFGLIILEYYLGEKYGINAGTISMLDTPTDQASSSMTYKLDTSKPKEKILLDGLAWVATCRHHIATEAMAGYWQAKGEEALTAPQPLELVDRLEALNELMKSLQSSGVAEILPD